MSTERSPTDFYITGGTMPLEAESYVERPADEELFRAIERGEYCYVLTTRQMGKSSLMARTAQRLAAAGVRSAQITLETIRESSKTPSPDQFLYGIASRIHRELRLPAKLADWWKERELLSATQRFHEYLTELLLEESDGAIVVFIDEIDSTIGLPFADDFYATIRACYNGRASKPELKRLTFVLLGVATPAQLITDPNRTPFNIGKGIELTDFSEKEAAPLAEALPGTREDRQAVMNRVIYWTGGHPYLTQTLCRAVAVRARSAATSDGRPGSGLVQVVDEETDRLFLRSDAAREEHNLKFVRSRLTQWDRNLRAVLRTYLRVLRGDAIEDKPASSIHASLKLAGVVRVDEAGRLRTRNQIYERVFGPEWVKRELPRDRTRMVAAAFAIVSVIVGSVALFSLRQATTQVQQAQSQAEQQALQTALLEHLTTSDFAGLVTLARKRAYPGTTAPPFADDVLAKVDPTVFAEGAWLEPTFDPTRLLDVIERGYRMYVPSRSLFGAMSFALEEVFVRSDDETTRGRARALSDTVRSAFIDYHRAHTANFQAPPGGSEGDVLNPWVNLTGGEFVMGDARSKENDEKPPHLVRIRAFSMQRHEVTNEEYRRFDPVHEFPTGRERYPVANVSWYEGAAYAAWRGESLPTEAEWEYAARGTGQEPPAGKKGRPYPWGFERPTGRRAVYGQNETAPVGSLGKPGQTPEGLDDMAGNVFEWNRDWYGPYTAASAADPLGPLAEKGELLGGFSVRVLRGGSFRLNEGSLRAAYRNGLRPGSRHDLIGFRVVSSRLRP